MSGTFTVRRALDESGLVPIDAQVLLAHTLKKDRTWLAAHAADVLDRTQTGAFVALARRRREGEPVAYLTGVREFWGLPLAVSPAVLIPRPETETVVELALASLPHDGTVRVLDLGTGSGAIALAIAHERPNARVLATDISSEALTLAEQNANRLGIGNVEFVRSNWWSAVPDRFHDARFDVVASNPPYVAACDPHLSQGDLRFEPVVALSTSDDGMGAIRQIVAGAQQHLADNGRLIIEHGYDQAAAVRAFFGEAGFVDVTSARDLAGIPRVVAGRR